MIGWLLASVVGIGVYTVAAALGLTAVALAAKPLPVLLLAIGAWRHGDRRGARWLAVALAVDSAADGIIELAFLGGLATFLVGHLLKIVAFTRDAPALHLARALPFAVVGGGACLLVVPGAGPLGLPIVVYASAICAMAWRAAARVDGTRSSLLGLVGAVLFVVSDSLIGVNRFVAPLPLADLWILGTYWIAQIATASSAQRG